MRKGRRKGGKRWRKNGRRRGVEYKVGENRRKKG
jgi:hypothetical protein